MEVLIGVAFAFALGLLAAVLVECTSNRNMSDPFEEGKAKLEERRPKPEEPDRTEQPATGLAGPFYAAGVLAATLAAMAKEKR